MALRKGAIVRIIVLTTAALAMAAAASAALAQPADFSGKWSLSGQIIAGSNFFSFAQICDLTQTGDQIAGPCRGPNAGCSLVGVLSAAGLDLTCRTTNANNPALAGVSTFHGAPAPDGIVRGAVSHSRFPGASGVFFMMRV